MLKLVRCELSLENWETIIGSLSSVARGMTMWQMRQVSPETNRTAVYRGRKYDVHLPSIAVEILTDDSWVGDIVAIVTAAHNEGRIVAHAVQVFPVEGSYRIRDGFMDL